MIPLLVIAAMWQGSGWELLIEMPAAPTLLVREKKTSPPMFSARHPFTYTWVAISVDPEFINVLDFAKNTVYAGGDRHR